MRFQDYISDSIQKATDEAFKAAKAVSEDKLAWSPLDNGRSVLDQLQELAQAPDYVVGMLSGQSMGEPGPDHWEKLVAERKSWTTIADCEREAKVRIDRLVDAIKNCPDENLTNTVWLPYDGGRDFTFMEIMEYPRWNANYHLGQINYIQTLYGDKEMH
ncbi:MAG TPA: DinB family protein [Fimbriimonadaceae bacterium]|nr:DinB family protein [Fimbriimonadaceae bacterium]